MIIQIDHIGITAETFAALKVFQQCGYNVEFSEIGILNPIIKQPLMKRFTERLTLTLLRKQGSYGIEVIDYGPFETRSDVLYYPVLENIHSDSVEIRGKFPEIPDYQVSRLRGIKLPVLLNSTQNGHDFCFQKLVTFANNLEDAAFFWSCFGFKKQVSQNTNYELQFKSPLGNDRHYLTLIQNPVRRKHFLDNAGISGFAFISNCASREREFLRSKKVLVTELEKVKVNHKLLDIFFAIGPGGELAEVIGVDK